MKISYVRIAILTPSSAGDLQISCKVGLGKMKEVSGTSVSSSDDPFAPALQLLGNILDNVLSMPAYLLTLWKCINIHPIPEIAYDQPVLARIQNTVSAERGQN